MDIPIIKCFCMWSDLLGFGSAFEKGKWTFKSQDALRNVARLQLLADSLYRSNDPFKEIALVLNDGLARVYDIQKPRDENQFIWWLHSAIANHWFVNAVDSQYGNPGIRSVLSFGERVRIWKGNVTMGKLVLGNSEFKRSADKKIIIYSPEEFQLNIAFSKAYIIESLGSKYGLTGPCLFVDNEALDAIESCITTDKKNILEFQEVVEVTEFPESAQSIPSMAQINFRVDRQFRDGIFRYEIFRELSEKEILFRKLSEREIQLIAIEFYEEPILISHHGINTTLWRVKRYNPIDEEDPFYFDFEDYHFRPPKI